MGTRFKGKTVLVTGATSGIGRAAAYAFSREGALVVACGRDPGRVEVVGKDVGRGRVLDVTDREAVAALSA